MFSRWHYTLISLSRYVMSECQTTLIISNIQLVWSQLETDSWEDWGHNVCCLKYFYCWRNDWQPGWARGLLSGWRVQCTTCWRKPNTVWRAGTIRGSSCQSEDNMRGVTMLEVWGRYLIFWLAASGLEAARPGPGFTRPSSKLTDRSGVSANQGAEITVSLCPGQPQAS